MYTYNQIVQINKDFWTNHKQVQSHYHDEKVRPTNIKYIAVYSNGQPFDLNGNELTYNFEISIVDRPNLKDKTSNDIEIISDTTQIAIDYIAYLKNTPFVQMINVNLTSLIEQAQGTGEDEVTGVIFKIGFRQVINYSLCLLPLRFQFPAGYTQAYGTSIYFSLGNIVFGTVSAPESYFDINPELPGIVGSIAILLHEANSVPNLSPGFTHVSGTYVVNRLNKITFTLNSNSPLNITYTIEQI